MSDKAKFEVRDVSPGSSNPGQGGGKKYMGQERRRTQRRSGIDRRTEVRFEPGKDDRRENFGRRADDNTPKFW